MADPDAFKEVIDVVNKAIGAVNGLFPDTPALDCVDPTPNIKRPFRFCSHVISEAPVGEHIAVRKTNSDTWHHGVYVGKVADKDGFYVIDFSDEAMIDLREVDYFCEGAEQIVSVGYDFGFPYEFSAEVAMVVYKANRGARYNCDRSNCEHFAAMCSTGRYDVHARVTDLLESNVCKRDRAPNKKFK